MRGVQSRPFDRLRGLLEVLSTIGVLVAASVVLWVVLIRDGRQASAASRSVPIPSEPVSLVDVPTMGSLDAKVAVLEFSDFQCPYCAQFSKDTLPALKSQYVDAGLVRFAFRQNPLTAVHPMAQAAAEAAACAGKQGKFWPIHDEMFQNSERLRIEDIDRFAGTAGVDLAVFKACIATEATQMVKRDVDLAKSLQVTGTPTFLVGRVLGDGRLKVSFVIPGARPLADFSAAIDKLVAGAGNDR